MNFQSKRKKIKSSIKRNLKLYGILLALSLILVLLILAPYIAPNDPYAVDLDNILRSPDKTYPLGTDSLGRCVLSRILYGGSRTIFSALTVVVLTAVFGTFIGDFSGYSGGNLDKFIMRIVDIFLAFPGLVLAIAVAGVLGGGITNAMISIALISWTKYARIARGKVVEIKDETFIKAARLTGNSDMYIMFKHVIPNIVPYIVVTASLDIGTTIMEIASLSFLGLSSPLPFPEWGAMISEGKSYIQFAPWTILAPGLAILIVVVLFNLLGDTVHDILDFKQKRRVYK